MKELRESDSSMFKLKEMMKLFHVFWMMFSISTKLTNGI